MVERSRKLLLGLTATTAIVLPLALRSNAESGSLPDAKYRVVVAGLAKDTDIIPTPTPTRTPTLTLTPSPYIPPVTPVSERPTIGKPETSTATVNPPTVETLRECNSGKFINPQEGSTVGKWVDVKAQLAANGDYSSECLRDGQPVTITLRDRFNNSWVWTLNCGPTVGNPTQKGHECSRNDVLMDDKNHAPWGIYLNLGQKTSVDRVNVFVD